MENSPKKSKALIITFILVLLLLIIGYYFFKNRDQIFGTKGLSVNKIFQPLLGSSKNKEIKVVDGGNTNPNGGNTTGNEPLGKSCVITTDQFNNKVVVAEAGEDLLKGDAVYMVQFNSQNSPIVKKAIANDLNKSLVFGFAGADFKTSTTGIIILSGGVLNGIPTNKKEGSLWAVNNTLFLSDKTPGVITKISPISPSLIIPVGTILKIDKLNGSIQISDLINNAKNSGLLNSSSSDMQDCWNSIIDYYFKESSLQNPSYGNINIPPFKGLNIPSANIGGYNGGNIGNFNGNIGSYNGGNLGNSGDIGGNGNNLNDDSNIKKDTIGPEPKIVTKGVCPADAPLEYTEEEQKALDDLTKKFYLISSTIKTEDDLNLSASEINEQQNLLDQVNGLVKECYAQKIDAGITEPVYGNPWYHPTERGTYIRGKEDFELMLNIW